MSSFALPIAVGLVTDYGKFTLHVLPEIIPLGTHEGRPAATLLEHYAMVPASFDPAKPATLHLHTPDPIRDLFAPTAHHISSAAQKILETLGQGENGLLLVIDGLTEDQHQALKHAVDATQNITCSKTEAITNAFQNYLKLSKLQIERVQDSSSPLEGEARWGGVKQETTSQNLSPFTLHQKPEIIRLTFPEAVQKLLFPTEPKTLFFKPLTHYALVAKNTHVPTIAPRVRVHSSCTTGDRLGSRECDCGAQFRLALARVAEEGGAVLYHDAEGRGIHSLAVKMIQYKAKAGGLDTYAAMSAQGYPPDARSYDVIEKFLRELGLTSLTLLTNNPAKKEKLAALGLTITATERILPATIPREARAYLRTKREQGGHDIEGLEDEQEF